MPQGSVQTHKKPPFVFPARVLVVRKTGHRFSAYDAEMNEMPEVNEFEIISCQIPGEKVLLIEEIIKQKEKLKGMGFVLRRACPKCQEGGPRCVTDIEIKMMEEKGIAIALIPS